MLLREICAGSVCPRLLFSVLQMGLADLLSCDQPSTINDELLAAHLSLLTLCPLTSDLCPLAEAATAPKTIIVSLGPNCFDGNPCTRAPDATFFLLPAKASVWLRFLRQLSLHYSKTSKQLRTPWRICRRKRPPWTMTTGLSFKTLSPSPVASST